MMVCSIKIKMNLRCALETAGFSRSVIDDAHSQELVTVKIDVDLDPPPYSKYETVSKTSPLRYDIRTEPLPVLFAGKTAAVLCRHWEMRVKGRDFYDFRWYVERGVPIDIRCLESCLDKKCNPVEKLDRDTLITLLKNRLRPSTGIPRERMLSTSSSHYSWAIGIRNRSRTWLTG